MLLCLLATFLVLYVRRRGRLTYTKGTKMLEPAHYSSSNNPTDHLMMSTLAVTSERLWWSFSMEVPPTSILGCAWLVPLLRTAGTPATAHTPQPSVPQQLPTLQCLGCGPWHAEIDCVHAVVPSRSLCLHPRRPETTSCTLH